jgi:hypothetical protein
LFYLNELLHHYVQSQEEVLSEHIENTLQESLWMANCRMPSLLRQLKTMEQDLDQIGLHLMHHEDSVTPPDVFSFAHTGGEASFGLLTDFGRTRDLTKAPVLAICPDDDPSIRLVAKNLRDFLSLLLTVKIPEKLAEVDLNTPEERWLRGIEKNWLRDSDDCKKTNSILAKMRRRFGLKGHPSVYGYIRRVRKDRQLQLACETLDGVGILKPGKRWRGAVRRYGFSARGAKNVKRIRAHLDKATRLEKLAFCRDAQHACILTPDYDKKIQSLVADILAELGLSRESERIRELR